jgi:toxic protein SymE
MVGCLGEYKTCSQGIAEAVPVAVSTHPTAHSCNVEIAAGDIMKNRKLKVRAGYYDRPYTGRISYSDKQVTQVPFVLLKGHWLEQANFLIGQDINVEVRENQLILTTEPS